MVSDMQAVIFLSHIYSTRIRDHFDRLKRETSGIVDCFFCLHRPNGAHEGDNVDFIITEKDEAALLPERFGYRKKKGLALGSYGFLDVVFLEAIRRAPGYEHYYMMEFDVDYSGDWKEFFEINAARTADFMGSHIHWRRDNMDWIHWNNHFSVPVHSDKHLMAQIVLMRMSLRMVNAYKAALESGDYIGNVEALAPIVALDHGLSIEDFGANFEFTPEQWRGKNYDPEYFHYRPIVGEWYWHERPQEFPVLGMLYHPIKPAGSPRSDA